MDTNVSPRVALKYSKEVYLAVDAAAAQAFGGERVTTVCPVCGTVLMVDEFDSGYEVRCGTPGCVVVGHRGLQGALVSGEGIRCVIPPSPSLL